MTNSAKKEEDLLPSNTFELDNSSYGGYRRRLSLNKAALMTPLRLTPPCPLLFLLMFSGVVSQQGWGVHYILSSICAVKGSTVIMACRYTYPPGHVFLKAFWTKEWVRKNREPPDLSLDQNYIGRVKYLRDRRVFHLSLSDVREQDRGTYYFRFLTTPGGKYQGVNGVELSVTELQVEMIPDRVVEGDKVTLTCKSTCRLTDTPTFNWYKQGIHFVSIYSSNLLLLQPVSQNDPASYSCSVDGQSYHSPVITLDVQYPPKSVSVSISPSNEIVKGSLINLTCSSDANPSVHSYTWYKVNESSTVGSGQSYSFTLSSSSSGWFYCEAENKYGSQRSAAVPLTLTGDRSVLLYVILGVMAGCGCLIAIFGVLFIRRKRRSGLMADEMSSQENTYMGVNLSAATDNPTPHPAVVDQDDVQYASIQHRTAGSATVQVSDSRAAEEVQYAAVQHRHDRVVKKTQAHDDQ